jgi:hypothetical protein
MARPSKTFPSVDPSLTGSGFQANPAVARCAKAWHRTFELASIAPGDDRLAPQSNSDNFFAHQQAAIAFRDAMPPLCGQQNVSDFIACTTFALLKKIIDTNEFVRLLHAAKIALDSLRMQSRLVPQTVESNSSSQNKIVGRNGTKSGAKSAA